MKIKQFEIWIADLNPRSGTETGKIRPVVVVQTDLLNKAHHPSTLICPLTTNIKPEADLLRVHIKKESGRLSKASDIMIDQLRAIDNKRLVNRVGMLPANIRQKVKENLRIILDLE